MQIKSGHGSRTARKHGTYSRASSARKHLPPSEFVVDGHLPPSERRFPIPDADHAGRALQSLLRIAGRHGVTEAYRHEALAVLNAVKKKFPGVYRGEHDLVREVMRTFGIEDR